MDFEMPEDARARHVRAAAHLFAEFADGIRFYHVAILRAEHAHEIPLSRLLKAHLLAYDGQIFRDLFIHERLYRLNLFLRHGAGEIEIEAHAFIVDVGTLLVAIGREYYLEGGV